MSAPEVAVIIPTFNRAGSIGRTLDSLRAQEFRQWECLVVDDGSSDDTDALMRTYCESDSRFRYLKRSADRKKGANACRNIGIQNAAAEFITFLDSDDEYLPEHLLRRMEHLRREGAAASLGPGYIDDGSERKPTPAQDKKELTWFDFLLSTTVVISSIFVRRDIAATVLFDEDLRRHQDWDFLLRMPEDLQFPVYPEPTFLIHWIRNEKRTIDFASCITVYNRHRTQLTMNEHTRRYLLNMYEKSVNYRAANDVTDFYRTELRKHFTSFSRTENFKLTFPVLYRTARNIVKRIAS